MQKNLIIASLITLFAFIGCTPTSSSLKTDKTDTTNQKPNSAYCPVNLYDNRDVLSCFDTRELCEKSVSKAPKYACSPRASLKFPPKK